MIHIPSLRDILIRCAVYISSSLDFSQALRRKAEHQEIRICGDGQENSIEFEPAVFKANTLVYFFEG